MATHVELFTAMIEGISTDKTWREFEWNSAAVLEKFQ